jgi:hypothetical protein
LPNQNPFVFFQPNYQILKNWINWELFYWAKYTQKSGGEIHTIQYKAMVRKSAEMSNHKRDHFGVEWSRVKNQDWIVFKKKLKKDHFY